MNPTDQNPQQNITVHNPISAMRPGERNIFEVRRHPIGIIGTYVSFGLLVLVVGVLAFIVVPMIFTGSDKGQMMMIAGLVFAFMTAFAAIFAMIAHKVYLGNRWILTSDSLTQVLQRSLFDKQSSQLSLGNLEDVTAHQDGILAHMFNYGVLRVETAGERSKFVFQYCPNPNYYAQQILGAREDFEQGRRGGSEQRPYREEGAYQNAPQNQAPIDNGINTNTKS